MLEAVIAQSPKRPRAITPLISKDMETIVQKALEKEPDQRYQTAAHLAGDLQCLLEDRPILAKPPSSVRRVRHWTKTHRGAVGLAATGLLLVALMIAFWQVRILRQESAAWLHVDTYVDGCSIWVRQVDFDTLELAPTETSLGSTPMVYSDLQGGAYRVVVATPDQDAYVEFDVLLKTGRTRSTTLSVQPFNDIAMAGCKVSLVDSQEASNAFRVHCARMHEVYENIPDDMVLIPAGEYDLGWAENDQDPLVVAHLVKLPAFYIDRFEVSNAQFKAFVDATGHTPPAHWQRFGYDDRLGLHPVSRITVEDARAFAQWRGKRLPTAFEWEAAMRSPAARRLPWTKDTQPSLPQLSEEQISRVENGDLDLEYPEYRRFTSPVDSEPALATELGLFHAATNVSEWTSSIAARRSFSQVVKGASWTESPRLSDLTCAWSLPEGSKSITIGFRCARSARTPLTKGEGS